MSELRIGIGYDMHAFVAGRPLVLGGVEVPYELGLSGHSDADVIVHALMDAALGAIRAGDIGQHFPNTDPRFAGISSMELLSRVAQLVRQRGFHLIDADIVLVMEQPKVARYRDAMRAAIAERLGVAVDAIGLKATTTEGLGAIGRGEGAAAQAVVLLERDTPADASAGGSTRAHRQEADPGALESGTPVGDDVTSTGASGGE